MEPRIQYAKTSDGVNIASWTRIHQTVAYDPLDERLAEEVAQRLAAIIAVLQPILEDERFKVPPELERATAGYERKGGAGVSFWPSLYSVMSYTP